MVCAIKTVEPKVDEDGFESVRPSKAAKRIFTATDRLRGLNSFSPLEVTHNKNKFYFQENESLYKEKEQAQK